MAQTETLYVTQNPVFFKQDTTPFELGVLDPNQLSKDTDVEFLKRVGALSTEKPEALIAKEAAEKEASKAK